MSDPELASDLYVLDLENALNIAMNSLAIFEYVTTVDQEVLCMWKQKRSGASVLLFAVRYLMVATAVMDLVSSTASTTKECRGTLITTLTLSILGDVLTAVFSTLRVYALTGGNVKLSAVVLLLQFFPVVAGTYRYAGSRFLVVPLFGCVGDTGLSAHAEDVFRLVSLVPRITGDTFVIIVTWAKSFRQLKLQHGLETRSSLSMLLFRDGTIYFLILLVLTVLQVCPLTSAVEGGIIGALSGTLPLILVNRFLLNLRQLGDNEAHSTSYSCTISIPVFRVSVDVAGNMGESLEHGWQGRDVDELEIEEVTRDAEENAPMIEDLARVSEEAASSGHWHAWNG